MNKAIIAVVVLIMALGLFSTTPSANSARGMYSDGHRNIGNFSYSNGVAGGEFVNFNINEQTGEVSNYKVNNTTIFEQVSYENQTKGTINVKGPMLWYYGMGASFNWSQHNPGINAMWRFIHIHDNPAGVFQIIVHGKDTVTYTLASGINAEILGNHTIEITGNNIDGMLIYSGKAAVSQNEITVKLGTYDYEFGNYTCSGGSVLFMLINAWHFGKQMRTMITNAIADGKMGGQLIISGNNHDFINYTYGFKAQLKMNKDNHIQVEVQAQSHEGKVLMLTIDKNDIQYDSNHTIIVKIDGQKLKMDSSIGVFDGGSGGKYAIVNSSNELTVIVYIPHFSEHSIDIESVAVAPSQGGSEGTTNTDNNGNGSSGGIGNEALIVTVIAIAIISAVAAVIWVKKK